MSIDKKRIALATVVSVSLSLCVAVAGTVDPAQSAWHKKYKKQENAPDPAKMLLNTDKEPDLKDGFRSLFNGKDLQGWSPKGGDCKFEVKNGMLVGTCVPGTPSTYLCTEKSDFKNFIFTCEMRWEVDGNSGVMFRAKTRGGEKGGTVYGPQAEMEGITGDRYWSGGIYGQSCGGYFYPVWLKEHAEARKALNRNGWNRLTISAQGNVVKTWINGVPVAHWVDNDEYPDGFFGLQIHKGSKGQVVWKNIKVKRLP